jgi:hypothetical protein
LGKESQGGAFTAPDGVPVFGVAACYCGSSLSDGENVLQPLRRFGPPLADMLSPMSYVQMQSFFEPFFPPGRYTYVKSNFGLALTDEAIATIAEWAGKSPSPYTFAPFFEHWHDGRLLLLGRRLGWGKEGRLQVLPAVLIPP